MEEKVEEQKKKIRILKVKKETETILQEFYELKKTNKYLLFAFNVNDPRVECLEQFLTDTCLILEQSSFTYFFNVERCFRCKPDDNDANWRESGYQECKGEYCLRHDSNDEKVNECPVNEICFNNRAISDEINIIKKFEISSFRYLDNKTVKLTDNGKWENDDEFGLVGETWEDSDDIECSHAEMGLYILTTQSTLDKICDE